MRASVVIVLMFGIISHVYAHSKSVGYLYARVGSVPLHLVVIDLMDPEIKLRVVLAAGGIGTAEAFPSMLHRTQPVAAITGTFFGQKTLRPVGDIVVEGNLRYSGFIGTGVCWTGDNQVTFVDTRRDHRRDWSLYEGVICGGPRLLKDGKLALDPRTEGYRDRRLYYRATRTSIAMTRHGKLVLAFSPRRIYYREMAYALQRFGAVEAIGLDGGTSSGLFYRGKYLGRPGRRLTNILVVFDRRSRFEQAQRGISPHG